MSLSQMNAGYDSLEDRILFRLNTTSGEEYRFFLTRRITFQLVGGAEAKIIEILERDHGKKTAQAIAEFKQEAATRQTNFNVEFKKTEHFPLGATPLLVMFVDWVFDKQIKIKLGLKDGRVLSLNLSESLLRSMSMLLQRMIQQAKWEAPMGMESTPVVEVAVVPPQFH